MDSLEIVKSKRKESIMSFGEEKGGMEKEGNPSLQDFIVKDVKLKRKNSLDQRHK